jgi:CRISPR/Cas system-associated exonuclease Cas4 (RecB family)
MTTTADLLLAWDRRRARSQQREMGMSEVGGCQRRAGYRLAGADPVDSSGSIQAVMGTAIHGAVEQVFREMQAAGEIPADDLVEHEVRFAGILGHLDRYDSVNAEVDDTKTTTQRRIDYIKIHGADRAHRWQIMLYAAALIQEGRPVRRVVIDYIARDTGNTHPVPLPFDPTAVKEALAWVKNIRDVGDPEFLNRDYAPDSAFCQGCPFRTPCWGDAVPNRDPLTVLFVDDPDALKWAKQLAKARGLKKAAERLEKEAKGALDAIRPNTTGKSDPVDVGYSKALQWTVSPVSRLNTDAVRAEYAKTGVQPPMNKTTEIKLGFVAKPAVTP